MCSYVSLTANGNVNPFNLCIHTISSKMNLGFCLEIIKTAGNKDIVFVLGDATLIGLSS